MGHAIESALADILARVRLDAAFYFDVTARAPWATLTPNMRNIGHLVMPEAHHVLPFHIMREGEGWCWTTDQPDAPKKFEAGDVLLLPRGHDHVIASARTLDAPPVADVEVYRRASQDSAACTHVDLAGDGPRANFVCGYLGAPSRLVHPFFESLPDMIVFGPSPEKWQMLQQLLDIATREQADRVTGGRLVATRLAETMLMDVVQVLARTDARTNSGWLAGMQDPQIAKALNALHRELAEPWTLERLARVAGVSRSVLASRFSELVGVPPMTYLQQWRLRSAADDLAKTSRPIAEIAMCAGYESETGFHRAFKREMGHTPGQWRALHTRGVDA